MKIVLSALMPLLFGSNELLGSLLILLDMLRTFIMKILLFHNDQQAPTFDSHNILDLSS